MHIYDFRDFAHAPRDHAPAEDLGSVSRVKGLGVGFDVSRSLLATPQSRRRGECAKSGNCDKRLGLARSTTWSGTILVDEAATTERAVSRELAFLARDSSELRPRPFLCVRYDSSEELAPRLARMHELGLLGVSARAALTIVDTARRTIVPRLPLAAPPRPPALAVDSGGLAELARRTVCVVDAIPVGQMRDMVASVRLRLESAVGRSPQVHGAGARHCSVAPRGRRRGAAGFADARVVQEHVPARRCGRAARRIATAG